MKIDPSIAALKAENERLHADLKRIQDERLTWAMACDCHCPACTTFDETLRSAPPQPVAHDAEQRK